MYKSCAYILKILIKNFYIILSKKGRHEHLEVDPTIV